MSARDSLTLQLLLEQIIVLNQRNNQLLDIQDGFSTLAPTYPARVSVSTTSVPILPLNLSRVYAHIINNGNATVTLQLGAPAVFLEGIPLHAGGMYTVSGSELWQGEITGVTNAGTVILDVLEAV